MKSKQKQNGSTLVVSLLMLIILSVLVISAINISSVDMRIAYNMQEQKRVEADAQLAIERVLSNVNNFSASATDTHFADLKTTVDAAECLSARPATGYTVVWTLTPEETAWEIVARTDTDSSTPEMDADPNTGARTTIHQGVNIKLPAGNCP